MFETFVESEAIAKEREYIQMYTGKQLTNILNKGMLDCLNEANNAIPTDGEFAKDVVAVCQHWFAEQHIPIQLDGDSYVLLSEERHEDS